MLPSVRRRLSLSTSLAAVMLGALGAAPAPAALPGSVYTQTNSPLNNEVLIFTRGPDGSISETSSVATGGNGAQPTPPLHSGILDSQGGVELSDSGHLLFAVNAGSDSLSSFRVLPGGELELVSTVTTGDLPVSVDSIGSIVYVVNEGAVGPGGEFGLPNPRAGTIQGYTAAASGQLTPIPGSVEPLSVTGSNAAFPAQIGFDATGRTLTVTHRGNNAPVTPDRIDTFVLGSDGTPGPAVVNMAVGDGSVSQLAPFGFAYDRNGHAIIINALDGGGVAGSISSYSLNTTSGALTFIDNQPTDELFACWIVITPDSKFAFVAASGTNRITRLAIAADGSLTELGDTQAPGAGVASDVALTPDGKYLTVLLPTAPAFPQPHPAFPGPDVSLTDTYAVGADGSLTLVPGGQTPSDLPAGVSGLAASAADSTAPDTALTSAPGAAVPTSDNTPTFGFTAVPSTEPNPTFLCSIDGAAATACSPPLTTPSLSDGSHTFSVAARDFGGNTDASPATRTFIVDTAAPDTAINAGPPAGSATTDTTPTFAFSSSESGSTFRCRVDNSDPTACASPFTTPALSSGSHLFSVAAIDAAGNPDPTPAVRTFTVRPRPRPRPQPGCPLTGTQRIGTNANNTLNGGPGVDIIFGLGGKDILRGRGNRDCLYGGSGSDRLDGGAGNDRMFASAGADRLTDRSGRDVFDAGDSNDRVDARDATRAGRRVADIVRCGDGRRDVALVDRRDTVARDCERVSRR